MAQHTPGPWTIEHARTLLRSNKECDYGRKPIDDAEVEANATLIAAAPDLLAALVRAEKLAKNVPVFSEMLPSIRAAIAKAVQP